MKRFLKWRTGLSLAVRLFKITPKSKRFALGKLSARCLTPIARKFSLVTPPAFALDSFDDYLWQAIFNSMTFHEIEFDPKIVWRQSEPVREGALIVTGHFFLNFFIIRWLHDRGFRQSTVIRESYERQQIFGTRESIEVIKPDAGSLLEIKRRINAGEVITICIDHNEPYEGWSKLPIPDRQIYITDTIFRFAEKLNIPLIFAGTKLNRANQIEIFSTRPVSKKSGELCAEFGEFLHELLTKQRS